MKIRSADGAELKEGDRVFNYYDGWWGTVGWIDPAGWFTLTDDVSAHSAVLNGERVCKVIPRDNPYYGTEDRP